MNRSADYAISRRKKMLAASARGCLPGRDLLIAAARQIA
jgi:hypothetical protein